MLHSYNPQPMSLPSINTYTLRFLRYSPGQILLVKPRHCIPTSHQYPYPVSTSYTLQVLRYNPERYYRLRSLQQGLKIKSRSHHDLAHLQPQKMSLPSINLATSYSFWNTARTNFSQCPPAPSGYHGWKKIP